MFTALSFFVQDSFTRTSRYAAASKHFNEVSSLSTKNIIVISVCVVLAIAFLIYIVHNANKVKQKHQQNQRNTKRTKR